MRIYRALGSKVSSSTKLLGLQAIIFSIFNASFYLKTILISREEVGIWGLDSTYFYSLLILLGIHVNVSTKLPKLQAELLLFTTGIICLIGLMVFLLANKDCMWFIIWLVTCMHFFMQLIVEKEIGFRPRTQALAVALIPSLISLVFIHGSFGLKMGLIVFYLISAIHLLYILKKRNLLSEVINHFEGASKKEYINYFKVYSEFFLVALPQILLDPLLKGIMPVSNLSAVGNYELINKGLSQVRTIAASSLRHLLQRENVGTGLWPFPLIIIGLLCHALFFNSYILFHFLASSILNIIVIRDYYFLLRLRSGFLIILGILNLILAALLVSLNANTVFFVSAYLMSLNAAFIFVTSYVIKYINGSSKF